MAEKFEKPQGWFLIYGSADGCFNSQLVHGWDEMRRAVAAEFYSGTYEEAQEDEYTGAVLASLDAIEDDWYHDGDWGPTQWRETGEQCFLSVVRVRDDSALTMATSIIAGTIGAVTRMAEEIWRGKPKDWIKQKLLELGLFQEIKAYNVKFFPKGEKQNG